MGGHRAPVATRAAQAPRQPTSGAGPSSPDRHPVRAAIGPALGDAASGDGLRLAHDLLAAPAGMANAGVWDRLYRVLLDRLGQANAMDWSRASLDSASVPAKRGARRPARTRRTEAGRARSVTGAVSPDVGWRAASGWARTARWWSARWLGSAASVASLFATKVAPTSTRPSSRSRPPSSAGATFNDGSVRRLECRGAGGSTPVPTSMIFEHVRQGRMG